MLFTKGWSSSAPELSDGLSSRGKQRYLLFYDTGFCVACINCKNMMINVLLCALITMICLHSLSFLSSLGAKEIKRDVIGIYLLINEFKDSSSLIL